MTCGQRFLNMYYDFADKCGDDIDVMVKAIKLAGCKRRPNQIMTNLENISADSEFMPFYIGFIEKINESIVDRAKWAVQLRKGKDKHKHYIQLTLPGF